MERVPQCAMINYCILILKVLTAPITAKMRDEALKPFTDAMKDVVCQTIEEQFNQFTPTISASVRAGVRQENRHLKEEIVHEVKHEVQQGLQNQAQAVLGGELHDYWLKPNVP